MDGNEILSKVQDKLKVEIKNCMIRPSVAVIQIGENEAGNKFTEVKEMRLKYKFFHTVRFLPQHQGMNKLFSQWLEYHFYL